VTGEKKEHLCLQKEGKNASSRKCVCDLSRAGKRNGEPIPWMVRIKEEVRADVRKKEAEGQKELGHAAA